MVCGKLYEGTTLKPVNDDFKECISPEHLHFCPRPYNVHQAETMNKGAVSIQSKQARCVRGHVGTRPNGMFWTR